VSGTEEHARVILARAPGWRDRTFTCTLAAMPVASPMQRGVDGHDWVIDSGERFFLKIPAEEALLFVDPQASARAAGQAGMLGAAPKLLWCDSETGAALWPFLDPSWRTAGLADLENPDILGSVIEVKRMVHRGPRFGRTRSVFDLIKLYAAEAEWHGVKLPDDYEWMLHCVRDIAAAIAAAGSDTTACHGDGIASNVMLRDSGEVLLVDWDEAVDADPYWDLGSLFAEAFPFDREARAALEHYTGRCDEALFARCRLYGIADDLAWATRSIVAAKVSQRVDVEFFKYAQWRFLRCRMALRDRAFEERLRML
jgi:thiamine kinase-like enzyme